MIHLKLREAVFPVALLAFVAAGVRYWNVIFNDEIRWLFLVVLMFSVVIRGQSLLAFRGKVGLLLGTYLIWCMCTIAWSEVPELSLLKGLALVMTVTAFAGAGHAWTLYSRGDAPLGFLLPIVLVALSAGLFDRGAATQMGTVEIYQGLTGNPNHLGAIVAMGFPYGVWQAYTNKSNRVRYFLSLGIVVALLGMLWLSGSRASMLCVLLIFTGFMTALNPLRRMMTLCLIGVLVGGAAIAVPAIQASMYERWVVKGNEEGGMLFTRQQVWEESYELAKQGGAFGGGFGVTIGSPNEFSLSKLGLRSVGYGREQGNTQLAVWEQTGMVGLVLYAALILGIVLELGLSLRKIRDRQSKVELGLLFGTVLGFLAQSVFEAWWVAPGSAESALFWAVLGAAYGTMRRTSSRQQHLRYARRRTTMAGATSPGLIGS